ncbi:MULTISPECIES: DUF2917 domain-containing protein [Ramlibacter]|nr:MULTISPECIES: DUF2917 domain-containing protein [Ramlibacter]MBA2962631.1 DUF2917 domain-containing protein [Ramlibacter sp. CGMCC 1.13660]
MSMTALLHPQQSTTRLSGTWKLAQGRATTLRPREDGVLRVAHGRVWLTFDGPHAGPANDFGDRVLGAGDSVRVAAGRRLVLESCDAARPVYFSWDFETAPQPAAARAVEQSWSDLRLALALGLRSAGRLARALVALGAGTLLPRPVPVPAR